MAENTYDIIVVGAGPAGSSAAEAAAREGMRVLAVERRSRIGRPVRCAEYIPGRLLGEASAGRGFVVQPVKGMKTFISGRLAHETVAPGFMIHRDLFDLALADNARGAGAEIRASTSAVGLDGNLLSILGPSGEPEKVEGRVIIGADGPHSRVGRWIGSGNAFLIPGIQMRAPLAEGLSFTEVHFSREIHAGYGWVFPKGEQANVGLGMKPVPGGPSITGALEHFAAGLVDRGVIKSGFSGFTAGWIPAGPLRDFVAGNVYLAGDAAGHTHPITGAGVAQAVLGGRMAGAHAARGVISGNVEASGREYRQEWCETFAESHERAWRRRLLLEENWAEMENVIRRCWVAFREYYAGS